MLTIHTMFYLAEFDIHKIKFADSSFLYPCLPLIDCFTDDSGRCFGLTDVRTMPGIKSEQIKLFGFLLEEVNSSLLEFRIQHFITRAEDERHWHMSVGRVHGLSCVADGGL